MCLLVVFSLMHLGRSEKLWSWWWPSTAFHSGTEEWSKNKLALFVPRILELVAPLANIKANFPCQHLFNKWENWSISENWWSLLSYSSVVRGKKQPGTLDFGLEPWVHFVPLHMASLWYSDMICSNLSNVRSVGHARMLKFLHPVQSEMKQSSAKWAFKELCALLHPYQYFIKYLKTPDCFLTYFWVHACVLSFFSHVWLFATLWTVAH